MAKKFKYPTCRVCGGFSQRRAVPPTEDDRFVGCCFRFEVGNVRGWVYCWHDKKLRHVVREQQTRFVEVKTEVTT